MPSERGILGQALGAANINTFVLLYQVPENLGNHPGNQAVLDVVISRLIVTNQAGAQATFSIAVIPGDIAVDAAIANQRFIHKAQNINANDAQPWGYGIALQPLDHIRVAASTNTVSFNLFGQVNHH